MPIITANATKSRRAPSRSNPSGSSRASCSLKERTENTSLDDSTNVSAGAAVIARSSASLSSETMMCEWPANLGFATLIFMDRSIFTSPSPGTRVPLISNSRPRGRELRLSSLVAA